MGMTCKQLLEEMTKWVPICIGGNGIRLGKPVPITSQALQIKIEPHERGEMDVWYNIRLNFGGDAGCCSLGLRISIR